MISLGPTGAFPWVYSFWAITSVNKILELPSLANIIKASKGVNIETQQVFRSLLISEFCQYFWKANHENGDIWWRDYEETKDGILATFHRPWIISFEWPVWFGLKLENQLTLWNCSPFSLWAYFSRKTTIELCDWSLACCLYHTGSYIWPKALKK